MFILSFFLLIVTINADLWTEMGRMDDLQQFRELCGNYKVAQAYLQDTNAKITVFAPVNDVLITNPSMRALTQAETISFIVDSQVIELGSGKKWETERIVRSVNTSLLWQ